MTVVLHVSAVNSHTHFKFHVSFEGKHIKKEPHACNCKYNILDNHYLSRPGIHHWRGKDSHNGRVWIQDTLLQHSGVLLHSPGQRHIVVLGPTSQRVEQQNRPAVTSLDETLVGVLHQKSVAVVDWVAELEGEYSI